MGAVARSAYPDLLDGGTSGLPVPRLLIGVDDRGHPAWSVVGVPVDVGRTQLRDLFGTASDAFVDGQIDALVHTLSQGLGRPPEQPQVESALALIAGVRPRNELEAALAVQMAATHAIALRLNSRLMKTDPLRHDFEGAGIIASKFMRAFAAQVEALAKLRRPPVQVVRVERLNISDGAQAVVGNVTTTARKP